MKLNDTQLKGWTNEEIYNRGLNIYRKGLVKDLHIRTNKIFADEMLEIHIDTSVGSEDNLRMSNVNIFIDNVNKKLKMNCQCTDFITKSTKGKPCEHITAVLFKYIYQYQGTTLKGLETASVDKIIDALKTELYPKTQLKKELKLEIKLFKNLYLNSNTYIELKIGLDKLYIVKNMKDFLQAAYDMKDFKFGQNFTYKPSEQEFTSEDKPIFELLMDIYEIEMTRAQYQVFNSNNSLINNKRVELPEKQFIKLINLIKERPINIVIDNIEHSNVNIHRRDMPIKFTLTTKDEIMEFTHSNESPYPLNKNFNIFWYDNNIYIPSEEQTKILKPFYNMLIEHEKKKIIFNNSEGEKLISFVSKVLKKGNFEIELDNNLKNKLVQIPLSIQIYLDRFNDGISANLVFKYDHLEINPLKNLIPSLENNILIRDIEKEEYCKSLLKDFGFEILDEQYTIKNEKDIVSFVSFGVYKLQEISEIFYSDNFKTIKIYNQTNINASVKLNKDDLLEFTFELEGVDKKELLDIFNSIKEKKKYHKLRQGGFVALEDKEIQNIARMIEFLNIKDSDLTKDKILLSKYNALYLDTTINENNMNYIERNTNFIELTENIKEIKDITFTLPESLNKIMRNYQKTGFNWFKTLAAYGFGGILADEMGLGKTLQTIAFLHSEKSYLPSLVVTPTSLVYNWKSEIEKFSPSTKVLIVSGNKNERIELLNHINDFDIIVTSYPLIKRDMDNYKNLTFNYCIIDEAQQIKNPNTLSASSVKEIKAKGYFALTGTPIENSLGELWSIFDFIMPGYLMSHNKFTKLYENLIVKDMDAYALEELNRRIKPFILRRMKKDVLSELPPKIEQKLVVEMTEEQKKLYAAYLENARSEINSEIQEKGFNKSKLKILSVLTRLRQICCDPSVFIEDYNGDSGKLQALDELLEECLSQGHKVLLFSQFTSVLKNISKRISLNNISHFYLDGNTKSDERLKLVNEFNTDNTAVFLISLKAGGLGLNLTSADIVIHFDPWWNPAVEDQATDRAHRIGQSNTVEVIKLLSQGSIEEKIYMLQEKKKAIIDNVINNNMNDTNILSQMTEADLHNLFS